jgi:hypothetical protein
LPRAAEVSISVTQLGSPARVALVAGARAPTCETCTSDLAPVGVTLVVHHPRGGDVELAVCDWCVQAFRCLAAVSGGQVAFALAESPVPPGVLLGVPRGSRPVGAPIGVAELSPTMYDSDGTGYVPRVLGRERADGTWIGWLEFVAVAGPTVFQTERETTQSKYEDLVYWASGLEPIYLSGAFARAHIRRRAYPHPKVSPMCSV